MGGRVGGGRLGSRRRRMGRRLGPRFEEGLESVHEEVVVVRRRARGEANEGCLAVEQLVGWVLRRLELPLLLSC